MAIHRTSRRYDALKELEILSNEAGVDLTSRGMPTYAVMRGATIVGFVVISRKSGTIRSSQWPFAKLCRRFNVPFEIWGPGDPSPFGKMLPKVKDAHPEPHSADIKP